MTEDNINWKGVELLNATGATLRVGTYTGMDGKPTPFTRPLLEKIFSKIGKPIPFYLTHAGAFNPAQTRMPIGYAYRVGLAKEGTDIHYKSFLFDESMRERFAAGYDATSAEVDLIYDDHGVPIDGELKAIAFVQNPAVPGTEATLQAVVLSKGKGETMKAYTATKKGVEKMLSDKGFPPEDSAAVLSAFEDMTASAVDKVTREFEAKVTELEGKLQLSTADATKYKGEFEAYKGKYSTMLASKVSALSAEVKAFGIASPDTIIAGLEPEHQIAVLERIKQNFASQAPVSTPAKNVALSVEPDAKQKAYEEVVTELGLGAEIARIKKARGE